MNRLRLVVLATVVLVGPLMPGIPTAEAFTPNLNEYYRTTRWDTSQPVTWNFASNFPGGEMRNRVRDGFLSWNALGQSLQFATAPGPDVSPTAPAGYSACISPRKVVTWEDLPGNNVTGRASSTSCYTITGGISTTPRYVAFEVTLDKYEWWWAADSDIPPPPPYISDVHSVATHEVGHVAGQKYGGDSFGHFLNSDPHVCPVWGDADYLSRETMCQSYYTNSRVQRNPDDHDRSLFNRAY